MAEVFFDAPRAWSNVPDQDGRPIVYHCDLTWLTSRWQCTFGRGCPGVDRPHQGCCSTGTFWADADDRQRVERAAERLTPELWQYHRAGQAGGTSDPTPDGPGHTRVIDGACVFLNREGFPTGPGCALHFLARAEGRSPVETKPDVCWQIPLLVTTHRGTSLTVTIITEYRRADWGPAGAFMPWWCSSDTLTHTASRPVYLTHAAELRAVMGDANYTELTRICDERLRHPSPPSPHPADCGAGPTESC